MLRFDHAVIDIPRRQVVVDGEVRHLEPQAFDLLAYLVTHRDRVVPKHELLDEVWGDQFVSESALTTRVKEIRRSLGDDGVRQAFVRNFRGRGYRFVARLADQPSPGSRPASAGRDATLLVGRDDDLAVVVAALERSRLVTLVGPGGVGKTTLAREVARLEPCASGRDVHLVQLATVLDDRGVRHAFERACGIAVPALDDEGLAAAVGDLDALVVVDNCEHVVAAAARFLEAIVRQRGPVTLLATSRERLGVGGEQVVPVEPLDRAAARRLLVERVREAGPGLEIDTEHEPVDRLLEMLDDLPLAIEMAAARVADVGVAELVELLGDRLGMLRSAHRGVEERHRTLAEVIEWSERLLDPGARRVLHDLSVFAGPVTAADVAAVVGSSAGELALGPLSDLVEHSLVVADAATTPTRYRLLGTVRAVVAAQRSPEVDERHARHVAAAVEEADRTLRGPDELDGVRRIRSLEAEIGVAHRWAREHDPALAARITAAILHYAQERQWSEPAAWARAMIDHPQRPIDAAPFAAAIAADAANRDDVELAIRLAVTAMGNDDPRVTASAHDTLASVGMYSGDLDLTAEHGTAQRALGERVGDSTIRTLGLVSEVLAAVYGGDPGAARHTFEAGRGGAPLSVTSTAWLAYTEGELLSAEGDDQAAIGCFRVAVELGTAVDNPFVVGVAQVAELAARARAGDITEAIRSFEAVLVQYRRSHHVTHAITALRNLIVLLVRGERDEPAMRLLGALSGPDVKATYGAESAELVAARAEVERRRGAEAARWIDEGAGRTTAWALDTAIAVLAAHAGEHTGDDSIVADSSP